MKMRGFIGGSNRQVSPFADQERTINLYVAPTGSPAAPSQAALYMRPGTKLLKVGASGSGRASFSQGNLHVVVIGPTVYSADASGTLTALGTVVDDGRPATISNSGDSGNQLFITSGRQGYLYDIGTLTFSTIAFLANKADIGAYQDGYFLAMDTTNSTVYMSDLLDGATWDPTNFIQRSQAPDPWMSMIAWNKYLYLIGSQTTEPWYNAGTFPIPFAPVPSTLIQYGTNATFAPVGLNQSVIFSGQSINGVGVVVNISGVSAETIDTPAVAKALEEIPNTEDCIGFAYGINGRTFYHMTFREGDETWVYDPSTNIWTENATFSGSEYGAWRVIFPVPAFGELRCLDLAGPGVYSLSDSFFVDPGEFPIRWERTPPAQFKENKRIPFTSVELFLEPGLADFVGQGANPQVMMQMSNDGGKVWGSEVLAGAGMRGDYGYRTRWDRLGMARNKTFKFAGSDPVPWRLVDAFIEMGKGADF